MQVQNICEGGKRDTEEKVVFTDTCFYMKLEPGFLKAFMSDVTGFFVWLFFRFS